MTDIQVFNPKHIQNLIFNIRGKQVMLDKDLAQIYGVETKRLNEAVKRNLSRFPAHFRFQLTKEEVKDKVIGSQIVTQKPKENLKSQIATSSSKHGGKRYLSYAFTEQGVAMLSSVLKSKTAVNVSFKLWMPLLPCENLSAPMHNCFNG
mgnify:FL=1|jgi:hypothetical protein